MAAPQRRENRNSRVSFIILGFAFVYSFATYSDHYSASLHITVS